MNQKKVSVKTLEFSNRSTGITIVFDSSSSTIQLINAEQPSQGQFNYIVAIVDNFFSTADYIQDETEAESTLADLIFNALKLVVFYKTETVDKNKKLIPVFSNPIILDTFVEWSAEVCRMDRFDLIAIALKQMLLMQTSNLGYKGVSDILDIVTCYNQSKSTKSNPFKDLIKQAILVIVYYKMKFFGKLA